MPSLADKSPRISFYGFLVHAVDHGLYVVITMSTKILVGVLEVFVNLLLHTKM
jgi:hypothetical protein